MVSVDEESKIKFKDGSDLIGKFGKKEEEEKPKKTEVAEKKTHIKEEKDVEEEKKALIQKKKL